MYQSATVFFAFLSRRMRLCHTDLSTKHHVHTINHKHVFTRSMFFPISNISFSWDLESTKQVKSISKHQPQQQNTKESGSIYCRKINQLNGGTGSFLLMTNTSVLYISWKGFACYLSAVLGWSILGMDAADSCCGWRGCIVDPEWGWGGFCSAALGRCCIFSEYVWSLPMHLLI